MFVPDSMCTINTASAISSMDLFTNLGLTVPLVRGTNLEAFSKHVANSRTGKDCFMEKTVMTMKIIPIMTADFHINIFYNLQANWMTALFGPLIKVNITKRVSEKLIPKAAFAYDIGLHVAWYHAYEFFERS
jgi:hypothetical protein